MPKPLFAPIPVNVEGYAKLERVLELFQGLLSEVEHLCNTDCPRLPNVREVALVATKLQEASFYAVRAITLAPENQQK